MKATNLLALRENLSFSAEAETVLPADGDTPETIRPGYYCAHPNYFTTCGLSFLIPLFLIQVLKFLGLAFSQMSPNFLRRTIGVFVRSYKEGIALGTHEFFELYLTKWNSRCPGRFYMSPRPSRGIIKGTPKKDTKWQGLLGFSGIGRGVQPAPSLIYR